MTDPDLHVRTASLLLVVDLQDSLLAAIDRSDTVLANAALLIRSAAILGVPIVATTQNAPRLGLLAEAVRSALPHGTPVLDKMEFSAARNPVIVDMIQAAERRQIVVCGIETHICVLQTAVDLHREGFHVTVVPDACSSRTNERHKLGMERIRDFGVLPAATESVVYEWLEKAGTDEFRAVLRLVK